MTDKPLMDQQLVLASSSTARYGLLKKLGIPFKVMVPDIDETRFAEEPIQIMVERLALTKVNKVAQQCQNQSIIIGCDQMVEVDGQVMGKPGNHEKAIQQLRYCSGRVLNSYTGLCVLDSVSDIQHCVVVHCRVYFKELSDTMIEGYLQRDQPYQCAGSIRAEGLGVALFTHIETDDMTALIGLPMIKLVDFLSDLGLNVLDPQYGACCM